MRKILFLLLISITIIACKKDNNGIVYGFQYFPIDSGKYVVYDVVDIIHDDLSAVHDTDYYQIREVIGEEDIDLEGETFNKMYRYKRESDTLNWWLKDVWVVKKSNRSVEVVEENDRVIKLAFSISYDQYWDCNALNNEDSEQCYYRNIYEARTVGTNDFDSTVVVEHHDNLNAIEFMRFYEIYAANVGRVKTVNKDLEISGTDTLSILKGTELFYTAVSWGG